MKRSNITSFSILTSRRLMGALILAALFAGGKIQAQTISLYVAESSTATVSGSISLTTNILDYSFNVSTKTATLLSTLSPSGIVGGPSVDESTLEASGNGLVLSYAGFNTSGKSVELTFTPTTTGTGTFNTSTVLSSGTVRSSYTLTGTSFFTVTGGTTYGVGNVALGGSALTTISSGVYSGDTIAYNGASNNLYFTRLSSTASANGVYGPTTGPSGLPTTASSTSFSELTGTGWVSGDVYAGLGFLGSGTLFTTDTTANKIDVFTSTTPTLTTSWTLSSLSLSFANSTPIQLSVFQLDSTDALVFFTTTTLGGTATITGSATNTFDEVTFNSTTGFGSVNVLGTSTGTTTSEFYSGIAAVPEPGTYALLGFGLGLMGLITAIRRKAGRDQP